MAAIEVFDVGDRRGRANPPRRTALIPAAVTGKCVVRNWQPPATQEVA